jgi:uncharacterized protein (DUF2249 family)
MIIRKYWPTIFTIVIIFISVLILFEILNFNLNNNGGENKKRLVVESFGPSSTNEFIEKVNDHDPVKLNKICNSFSTDSCKNSSFCVLLDGNKCVGGNSNGPTFLTQDGKDITFTNYIHKDVCRGQC